MGFSLLSVSLGFLCKGEHNRLFMPGDGSVKVGLVKAAGDLKSIQNCPLEVAVRRKIIILEKIMWIDQIQQFIKHPKQRY